MIFFVLQTTIDLLNTNLLLSYFNNPKLQHFNFSQILNLIFIVSNYYK